MFSGPRSTRHSSRSRGGSWRALLAMVLIVAGLAAGGQPASAHTGFESSTPADGDVVAAAVSEVTVRFTGPAEPAGDEFQALDGDGTLRDPTSVTAVDDRTFVLSFDPPLSGGTVGIRWSVAAPDTHPIAGAFSFTVDAPAPTTPATTEPVTTEPATTPGGAETEAGSSTEPGDDAATAPATGSGDSTPAAEPSDGAAADAEPDETAVALGDDAEAAIAVDDADPASGDTAPAAPIALDEFLDVEGSVPGETTARIGRVIGFVGVALALGWLAFAATTFRGTRHEVVVVLRAVRAAGAILAVGAAIEYVGVARIAGEAVATAWSIEPGVAAMMRVLGGLAIALGITVAVARPDMPARALSAAPVVTGDATVSTASGRAEGGVDSDRRRWAFDRRSSGALVGAAAVLVSFWFDGHTVSKGFRPLHAVVNTVHVAAGSIWVGGVVALAAVAWWRRRSGRPPRLAEMTVRFSSTATIALASVVVAGLVMAFLVLDSLGDLTSTQWGQTLLLKSAAVGLAALAGGYNHVRLVPRLQDDPDDPALQGELRSTLTAEAILLGFVVVVTAWLVVAAS